jgi:hypothetical protein
MSRRGVITLVVGVALLGVGCATVDSISGSGSMRIDVEVYKGPLAQDPMTQFGELAGAMVEAVNSFGRYRHSLERYHEAVGCDPADRKAEPSGVEPAKTQLPTSRSEAKRQKDEDKVQPATPREPICVHLSSLLFDADLFRGKDERLTALHDALNDHASRFGDVGALEELRRHVRQTLRETVEVATRMRAKAYFWAGNQVVDTLPFHRTARAYMVTFSFLASEYSNQIATRADALLQQMAGQDRREVPLSLLLRNANANDFINLYIWNRATSLARVEDFLLRPLASLTSEETADRVRAYERLFGDYNWSNVNTVYASGQGDVSMAFIKDDIGNWSLKSFDNDPAELLKAYTNVGKAAVAEAAKLVSRASGYGAAAEGVGEAVKGASEFVKLADRVAFGRAGGPSPTVGGLDVTTLHNRAREDIARLAPQARAEQEALPKKIDATKEAITKLQDQAQKARDTAKATRARKDGNEAEAAALEESAKADDKKAQALEERSAKLALENEARQERLDNAVRIYAAASRRIVERLRDVVELLQESVATARPGGGAAGGGATSGPARSSGRSIDDLLKVTPPRVP